MLTGDPPHHASTAQATVAKILSERPSPISHSRDLVPANVDAAIQRALSKSPADRFVRAAHFADALTNPGFRLPETGQMIAAARTAPQRRTLVSGLTAATLALGLFAGWLIRTAAAPRAAASENPPVVFFVPMDSGAAIPGYPAVSPQGNKIVYPAGDAGSIRLFLRNLDDPIPAPLPRTEGAHSAFFSPNGEWVGFVSEQTLKRVRLGAGSDEVIAPFVEGMAGATWREDDTILFATLPGGSLFEVPATGGTPKPLVIGEKTFAKGFFFPHFLPGGKAIVFNTEAAGGLLGVLNLTNGEHKTFSRGLRPSYVESGHLIYADPDGRLTIQQFDLDRLDTTGTPSVLPDELGVGRGNAFYSVSRGGTLAVIRAAGTDLDLAFFDRAGKEQVVFRNGGYWAPRFSPDGNQVAFGATRPEDISVYDIPTKTRRRLTLDGANNNDPTWSPDGRQLAFSANRPTRKDLLVRNADGSGVEQRVVVREGLQWPTDWTRDGFIVYTEVPLDEDRDIMVVKADGSEPPFAYLDTPFSEKAADVSPDGRWIAYDSNASGRFEVFVDRFPRRSTSPVILSRAGGRNPRWSADGRELFYWENKQLISVHLDLPTAPTAKSYSRMFETNYAAADHANYDVHPDGSRFVIVQGRGRPQRIVVALNATALSAQKR